MTTEDPLFLGFGAFETTAFCTAVFVACYSLISNPTGRQGSADQAEYQVYSGWRFAIISILAQLILMIIVIVQQIRSSQVSPSAKIWLIALMIAPWAPLAGKVRDTITSGAKVRRMMRNRLVRNELAAIVRDRFKFGQRGIALPSIIHHATQSLPNPPLAALKHNKALIPYVDELRKQAVAAAQTDNSYALELGSLWTMNQSLQPSSISKTHLFMWKLVTKFDMLARFWTCKTIDIDADPMPEIHSMMDRARYLDMADLLQQGGTVSDELMTRGMKKFCQRCCLATRCAVESFLESSERGHTDLRAGVWLRNIGMNWRGNFERVMDVMWEAVFIDAKASKIDFLEQDSSPDFGDRTKITTTKTLALLFLIVRSLLKTSKEHPTFQHVASIVRDGPFVRSWWDRYWSVLAQRLSTKPSMPGSSIDDNKIGEKTRAEYKAALRQVIDEDMSSIVREFLHHPINDSICGDSGCFLNGAKLILQSYE